MTNKEIYELAIRLGMFDQNNDKDFCCSEEDYRTNPYYRMSDAERFEVDSKDIVNVVEFVNDLTLYNDLDTIKQFLVCLLTKNTGDNNV